MKRILFAVVLAAAACTPAPPLRDSPLMVGAAISTGHLSEPAYVDALTTHFNAVVAEWEMKWSELRPAPGVYDFTAADRIVDFATANNMKVRGHTLVWYRNPAWLVDGGYSSAEATAIFDDHIRTVVSRYGDRVAQWDVANEVIADDGTRRPSYWQTKIGAGYIGRAFRIANEVADPNTELCINDYNVERAGVKADALFRLVVDMKAAGLRVDCVGFQTHITPSFPVAELEAQMARYEAIGVKVAVTEIDVRIDVPASETDLGRQADTYRAIAALCRDAPNCDTFTSWGVTDKYSWINGNPDYPGKGAALLTDANYQEKPALVAVREELT